MNFIERFKEWFVSNADQLILRNFPDPQGEPIHPDHGYFALWLSHGFLRRDREWLNNLYPAVRVSARLTVAGQVATITRLAQPEETMQGPGVWLNYPVTGLLPYRGGSVEVEAALSALKRSSYLGAALDVISDFSTLIAPPLSEAITIAGKVSESIQKVLDAGGEQIELGLHQSFVAPAAAAANPLVPGSFAVVKASADDLDPETLRVDEGRLCTENAGELSPLEQFDYMLFRIEGRTERDDWRFENINKLIAKAVDASMAGETDRFEGYRNTTLAEILKSPDLSIPDRSRVANAILDEFEMIESYSPRAVGIETPTLETIVTRHAAPLDPKAPIAEISLAQLLSDR